MTIRIIGPMDHVRMPWANGRGVTHEIARQETPGGRLLYRLSIAEVAEPGAFSHLPGLDRHLVLIEGAGFDLLVDGDRLAVGPLAPVAFPGEAAVETIDFRGPSRDFNVMTARGLASAVMSIHHQGLRHTPCDISFGFVVSGPFGCGDHIIGTAGLLVAEGGEPIEIVGHGCLVLVDIKLTPEGRASLHPLPA